VQVNADLTAGDLSNVFVVGDAATITDRTGRMVPGIAPAAKQMGRYAGSAIARRVRHQLPSEGFRYRHYGELATIGRRAAIVNLAFLRLKGFTGWIFWSVAHIYFLIGARNRVVVAFNWFWRYLTFQRGARLISSTEF